MADWIHCNSCFEQPKNTNSNFVLTSCGHIFCAKCKNRDINQCNICKTTCALTKLTPNLTSDVRCYFEDIEELLKKVCHVIKFQKSHRLGLLKAHKKIIEKYQATKAHIRKLEIENSSLKKKLEYYEKSRISPSPKLSKAFHFTPNSQKISPFFNSSVLQKPSGVSQQNFPFREPNLQFYQHYRNAIQKTPDESPTKKTPRNFSTNSNLDNNIMESKEKSRFSIKTPPYNDFIGMKITERPHMY